MSNIVKMNINDICVAVVGLGYVGLPLAVAFAKKKYKVIGFDINDKKINKYISGVDPTQEIGNNELKNTNIHFTCDDGELKRADYIIVAVPTPVNSDHTPDLAPVENASILVGKNLRKGAVIVF